MRWQTGEFRQFSMIYSRHSPIGVIRVEEFSDLEKAMIQAPNPLAILQ
jgi:hypothetical protein